MEELLVKATNTYQWEAATLIYGPHPSLPSPWRVLACGPEGIVTDDRRITLQTVDRIGAGDAFAAGFLTGYLYQGSGNGAAVWSGDVSAEKHLQRVMSAGLPWTRWLPLFREAALSWCANLSRPVNSWNRFGRHWVNH